ncbi:MAG: hypothetical protein QW231_06185, partial [Candidatus Bathyarchaeia archaeon]
PAHLQKIASLKNCANPSSQRAPRCIAPKKAPAQLVLSVNLQEGALLQELRLWTLPGNTRK